MNVLLINGSPHQEGCTNMALRIVAEELEKNGVTAHIAWVGNQPISGCTACGACAKSGSRRCVIQDALNPILEQAEQADGFIFGSPVHYASACGAITSLMDRMFFCSKGLFRHKPAASVVSCRRGGGTASFDQLNKYFTISEMLMVGSNYWNMVHGSTAQDVLKDEEGVQTMRLLARNMAWLLKCLKAGADAGVAEPPAEAKIATNYIR